MSLYKFIENEFFQKFFETGSLRLGTVLDFNDTAEYGENRGDENEGVEKIFRVINSPVTLTKDSNEPLISNIFQTGEHNKVTIMGGGKIVQHRKSEDRFIFCTSRLCNANLFREWNSRENLDSCYEIFDVNGFITAINEKTYSSTCAYFNRNIIYTEPEVDYRSHHLNLPPEIKKNIDRYSWQWENRTVWLPRLPFGKLKPWIIEVPEAVKYCRPYAYFTPEGISYHR